MPKGFLKQTHIKVDTADSGDAAIALFKRNLYDVIFLDHMMPDKDGIETIKEMKACTDTPNQKTPVICLTANAVSGMREMYINAGFDDYLTKPIDTSRLESILLAYLPRDLVEKAEENGEEKKEPAAVHNILIINEEVELLRRLRELMPDHINAAVVKSREQALAYLKKHEPELVLMDSNTQELDGLEKAKRIQVNFKELSPEEIISQVDKYFDEGGERREHE